MNSNTQLFGIDQDGGGKHRHNRMLYYQILCKVLFAEEVTDLEFEAFMKGFEQRLDELAQLTTIHAFQQVQVKVKGWVYKSADLLTSFPA
jgi:exportin-7